MLDRRRRAALLPLPATAGWYPQPSTAPGVVVLPRDHRPSSSSPQSPDSSADSPDSARPSGSPDAAGSPGTTPGSSNGASGGDRDNPFAPPPADAPDQEWRPRHPGPHGSHSGDDGEQPPQGEQPQGWGSQWSSRQPGRQSGGFGNRPGRNGPQGGGPGGPGGGPGGLRWDPTDPAQRRARYALLSGMWAFFFVLFSMPEIALLLGSLALYWGISSLRAKPAATSSAAATTAAMEGRPAPTPGQPGAPSPTASTRPQTTAAISGLVTASLALMLVAATFALQLAYRDYFTCVDDALTQSAAKSCEKLLPEQLRPLLSTQE